MQTAIQMHFHDGTFFIFMQISQVMLPRAPFTNTDKLNLSMDK